jgi:nucleotide-binding universal stress UspA family protein
MKVLCAVDGSKHSKWALEALRRWPFPRGSALVLVHMVDTAKYKPHRGAGEGAEDAMRQALGLAEETGRTVLAREKAALSPVWGTVDSRLVRGHPAESIVRTAAKLKADMIVMGSRGLTDVRAFLLGSVSRKVVVHAGCPVLLVKKRVPVLRRIVVGMDASKDARAGLEFLLQMPLPEAAHLTVVSVVPPLPIEASMEPPLEGALLDRVRAPFIEEAHTIAKQAAERIEKAGFQVSTAVVHGHPSHEIVKLAEAERADLAVVGSRGLSGTTRFLMGSVSDGVIKYAPCSVLVFRR